MPPDDIAELLEKQRLVEGLVHSQQMQGKPLVETLVRRQHLGEIRGLLGKLPSPDIARMLESMPPDDASQLWRLVPPDREDELLWELSDELRARVAGGREPRFSGSQVSAFQLVDGHLRQTTVNGRRDLDDLRPIWIDLLNASRTEREAIGRRFGTTCSPPGSFRNSPRSPSCSHGSSAVDSVWRWWWTSSAEPPAW